MVVILGNGETKHLYKGGADQVIGLTYIELTHNVDKLVVMDSPERYERKWPFEYEVISRSKAIVYSKFKAWENHVNDFHFLPTNQRFRHWNPDRDVPVSHTSAIPAIGLAYNLGFKDIVLYGVDIVGHKSLMNKADELMLEFQWMRDRLKALGSNLYLGEEYGLLSKILPRHGS